MSKNNQQANDASAASGGHRARALIYLRTATSAQTGDGDAVEQQRQACHALAGRLGATVEGEFSDLGASGLEPNRPGLNALRARLAGEPQVAYVIVARPDRVARRLDILREFHRAVDAAGAELVAASGTVWSLSDHKRAELEDKRSEPHSSTRRDRVRKGMHRRAEAGLHVPMRGTSAPRPNATAGGIGP